MTNPHKNLKEQAFDRELLFEFLRATQDDKLTRMEEIVNYTKPTKNKR